jgi:uncharacterized Ntn-hydrolase superfamily protein
MTLSIIARCAKNGNLGACVTTVKMGVGNRVPHVESNVGAICTQAYTNVSYGIKGLKLLKLGFSPQTTLEALLKEDPDRDSRQVAIIDNQNRTAAFTGTECTESKGQIIGDGFVIIGNKLTTTQVLDHVKNEFLSSGGNLANKLLSAIEAGLIAGGDENEKSSAALLVAEPNKTEKPLSLHLRVDYHKNPIKELRRIFEHYCRTHAPRV